MLTFKPLMLIRISFLQDLRHTCLEEEPGNKDFWSQVQKLGREISLISKSETQSKADQAQAVTEARAAEVGGSVSNSFRVLMSS